MAIIRFKSRALIRRFGSAPVEVPDSLAKQYTDRGQAIYARSAREVKAEEVVEEEVVEEEEVLSDEDLSEEKEAVSDEEPDTQDQDSEEEKIEVKITKKGKKK